MAFEKKVPEWNAPGIEPPSSLKDGGFTAGYKPPAEYFNWFWYCVSEALKELQAHGLASEQRFSNLTPQDVGATPASHLEDKNNPHGVTSEQVGATPASHMEDKNNPHGVTAAQVGATPASHATDKNNPHGVTAAQVGAAEIDHTHDVADISGTLPISKGGTGSTSATAALTNLGAAKNVHKHAATDINSGTLSSDRLPTIPISKGGTGAADASKARENLGLTAEYWTFTLEDGQTVTKLVYAT